jgi:hypothetical protein
MLHDLANIGNFDKVFLSKIFANKEILQAHNLTKYLYLL